MRGDRLITPVELMKLREEDLNLLPPAKAGFWRRKIATF
jgi:hypothetical protein